MAVGKSVETGRRKSINTTQQNRITFWRRQYRRQTSTYNSCRRESFLFLYLFRSLLEWKNSFFYINSCRPFLSFKSRRVVTSWNAKRLENDGWQKTKGKERFVRTRKSNQRPRIPNKANIKNKKSSSSFKCLYLWPLAVISAAVNSPLSCLIERHPTRDVVLDDPAGRTRHSITFPRLSKQVISYSNTCVLYICVYLASSYDANISRRSRSSPSKKKRILRRQRTIATVERQSDFNRLPESTPFCQQTPIDGWSSESLTWPNESEILTASEDV